MVSKQDSIFEFSKIIFSRLILVRSPHR